MVELSRRRAIEDVASELFRAHGYAATSVRDIARGLEIQGPSLYAHVTSKEDVLWAIIDRAAGRFEAAAVNQRWVGDTTEFVIGDSGKLYLAAIEIKNGDHFVVLPTGTIS